MCAVSFHGSELCSGISSLPAAKARNVAVRLAWNSPCETHLYLIEEIPGCLHPKEKLASRLFKFVE